MKNNQDRKPLEIAQTDPDKILDYILDREFNGDGMAHMTDTIMNCLVNDPDVVAQSYITALAQGTTLSKRYLDMTWDIDMSDPRQIESGLGYEYRIVFPNEALEPLVQYLFKIRLARSVQGILWTGSPLDPRKIVDVVSNYFDIPLEKVKAVVANSFLEKIRSTPQSSYNHYNAQNIFIFLSNAFSNERKSGEDWVNFISDQIYRIGNHVIGEHDWKDLLIKEANLLLSILEGEEKDKFQQEILSHLKANNDKYLSTSRNDINLKIRLLAALDIENKELQIDFMYLMLEPDNLVSAGLLVHGHFPDASAEEVVEQLIATVYDYNYNEAMLAHFVCNRGFSDEVRSKLLDVVIDYAQAGMSSPYADLFKTNEKDLSYAELSRKSIYDSARTFLNELSYEVENVPDDVLGKVVSSFGQTRQEIGLLLECGIISTDKGAELASESSAKAGCSESVDVIKARLEDTSMNAPLGRKKHHEIQSWGSGKPARTVALVDRVLVR